MNLIKKVSEDGSIRFFREQGDEEPLGVITQSPLGGWVIRGHEGYVFATPHAAEAQIGIVSAFDYIPSLLRSSIPALYSSEEEDSEGKRDPIAQIKLFTPWSNWTWYIIEASYIDIVGVGSSLKSQAWRQDSLNPTQGPDVICFGYAVGPYPEYGTFSLGELVGVRGPAGMRVERDLFFKPTPMSKLKV
jgi:hypothetical protein